jgi:hypothetical protein
MNQAQRLKSDRPSKKVKSAIKSIIKGSSLKDKTKIANMAELELSTLHLKLGKYFRNEFGHCSGSYDLINSCGLIVKRDHEHEDEASSVIMRKRRRRLGETYKLRIIK